MHHCHENISDIEGAYALDKIPQQKFALQMQGGLCARGAYLRDTMVTQICGGNPISISDLA